MVAIALLAICTSMNIQAADNEVVRLVSVKEEGGAKRIEMRSKQCIYVFICNVGTIGCTTPIPGKDYWLLTAASPVGKLDLERLKNWYVEYHNATNMGIIPAWHSLLKAKKVGRGERRG